MTRLFRSGSGSLGLVTCILVLACHIGGCDDGTAGAAVDRDEVSSDTGARDEEGGDSEPLDGEVGEEDGDGGGDSLDSLDSLDSQGDASDVGDGSDVADTVEPPLECPPYQDLCDDRCIPTSTDPANCGGCGVSCDPARVCVGGGCVDACPAGLFACAGRCVDLKSDSQHCNACDFECAAGTGCVDGTCAALVAVGPAPQQCDGGGPVIGIETPTGERCSGNVAETAFRWAICSCRDIELSNPLTTDAYDSAQGPYVPGGLGAGVGMNGDFTNTGWSQISGTLWSSSSVGGVRVSNMTDVLQELHSGGPLTVGNPFTVGLDAYVVGDITTSASLDIGGTLHKPPAAEITGPVTYGALLEEPVTVSPPCDCEPDQLIPVEAIVAARRSPANDNALIGLDADALVSPGAPLRLDLPCGHYYLSAIDTNAPLVISAKGRVALYIDGDVSTGNPLALTVDPAGSLDVFIAGSLTTSAKLTIGSPSYPALTRVYLGSVGTSLLLTNDVSLSAFVYTGLGRIDGSNPIEVYGGLFAGDFRNTGSTTIHYDRQILEAGESCDDDMPGGCESCRDCGNQACVDGSCGACTSSDQCCAPLMCQNGECVIIN